MLTDVALLHGLYLKQIALLKTGVIQEIVPVRFDYQGLIIVETGVVETERGWVVFQTHSCGCGPQPRIRGAWKTDETPWAESRMRETLAGRPDPKDAALAGQTLVAFVYRIRRATDTAERLLVTAALRGRFGNGRKIDFF